jgi:hypothetical protein
MQHRRRVQALAFAFACVTAAACGLELVTDPGASSSGQPLDDASLVDVPPMLGDGDIDGNGSVGANTDASIDADATMITCPPGFALLNGKCLDRARSRFTLTANPSGNWTWAFRLSSAASPIVTYPTSFTHDAQAGIQVWSRGVGNLEPSVFINPNPTVVHPYGTFTMEPGELAFHPGSQNERSVVRWTAPSTRLFAATVSLHGLSGWNGAPPTTTTVTVLKNTSSTIGSVAIPTDAGSARIDVDASAWNQGDTLDVLLDYGSNGNYGYDSTGIDVIVSAP